MRAMRLNDLVGMHEIGAFWMGTARDFAFHTYGVQTNGLSRTAVAVIALGDLYYIFEEVPLEVGGPQDRSTMCGDPVAYTTITMLIQPDFPWQWLAPRNGPAIVATFRLLETDKYELLYAVDEASGKCVFKVGTDLKARYTHVWQPGQPWASRAVGVQFLAAFHQDGVEAPWLEPEDDNPPVEIPSKKKHQTELKATGGKYASHPKGLPDKHEKYAHWVGVTHGKVTK